MEEIDWNENFAMAKLIVEAAHINCTVTMVEEGVILFDDGFTIRDEVREFKKETLGGRTLKKKKQIYVVEVAKYVNHYPTEPDEIDIVEIGAWDRIEDAITNTLIALVTNDIKIAAENVYMGMYYEQMKEKYGEGA